MRHLLPSACLALVPALAGCVTIRPDRAEPATPQRPTFSNNASTTAAGTLEVEAGVELDPGDRFDSPIVLKAGLDGRTEAFVGVSPLVWLDDPDGGWGIGDLFVGARRRFLDESDDLPALALQGTVKLPTADADDGFGSGETDVLLAAIAQKAVEQGSLVGFYQLGLLGAPGDTGLDIGHDLALAYSAPVAEHFGAFAELAGQFVPEYDLDSVFATLGATFSPTPSTVLDFGVRVGLSDDAPDFSLFVGTTRNLGTYGR